MALAEAVRSDFDLKDGILGRRRDERWGEYFSHGIAEKEGFVAFGQKVLYAFARQASKMPNCIAMMQTVPDGTSRVGVSGRKETHREQSIFTKAGS